MKRKSDNCYTIFKEDVYNSFVQYLLNKYDNKQVIDLIHDEPLFTKQGVNPNLTRMFNRFLAQDKKAEKAFMSCNGKTFSLKNIENGTLHFPVDPTDDQLMVKYAHRVPLFIPVDYMGIKRGKMNHEPMKGQYLRGNNKEHKFITPKKLTIHLIPGRYGKSQFFHSTYTFWVNSKEDVINIVWYRYRGRVASYQLNGKKYEIAR